MKSPTTSAIIRNKIAHLHHVDKLSVRSIAARLSMPKSTVGDICKRTKNGEAALAVKPTGRPTILTKHDRRFFPVADAAV